MSSEILAPSNEDVATPLATPDCWARNAPDTSSLPVARMNGWTGG